MIAPVATARIEAILDYISANNVTAAEKFGTALLNHVEQLTVEQLQLDFHILRDAEFRKV